MISPNFLYIPFSGAFSSSMGIIKAFLQHSPGALMVRLITGQALSEAVQAETFIKGGSPSCAEGIKYDFRLGQRVLKAAFKVPVNASELSATDRARLVIEPGEMVFVLSEERLDLPADVKAELSPKRKLGHDGVMVMGGLCIDPLYKGHLLVGMLNFSSTPYTLLPGRKLIAATFYRLSPDETGPFPVPDAIEDFPEPLIQTMAKYQPMAWMDFQTNLQALQMEVGEMKRNMRDHESWYQEFKTLLDDQKGLALALGADLRAEVDARKHSAATWESQLSSTAGRLEAQISTLSDSVNKVKAVGIAVSIVATLIAVAANVVQLFHK